jgi:hypothetical protein
VPLPAAVFSVLSPVLFFYPLAAEPRGAALARIALVQFVPPDTAFRFRRPTSYGCMYDGRLTPQMTPG